MRLFSVLYVLFSLAVVSLRIDSWPISNFKVFSAKRRIPEAIGYRWTIEDPSRKNSKIVYHYPNSKVHDSFVDSMELLRKSKASEARIKNFIIHYVRTELRIRNRKTEGLRVTVIRLGIAHGTEEFLVTEKKRYEVTL